MSIIIRAIAKALEEAGVTSTYQATESFYPYVGIYPSQITAADLFLVLIEHDVPTEIQETKRDLTVINFTNYTGLWINGQPNTVTHYDTADPDLIRKLIQATQKAQEQVRKHGSRSYAL